MRKWFGALGLGLFLGVAAFAGEGDVVIDPARGIGPITFEMVEAQMLALAPHEQRTYFYRGKGWSGTWLWPDQPSERIIAVLSDPPDDRSAYLVLSGMGSNYVLPNGLRLGSSLAEVEALNGGPFLMRGMGQDDGGEVLSWNGGRLAAMEGVTLYLYPVGDILDDLGEAEMELVYGGCLLSSAPVWRDRLLEVRKIQIARPGRVPASGPAYAEPVMAVEGEMPAAVRSSLVHPDRARYFTFGRHALVVQSWDDEDSYSESSSVRLYRRGNSGGLRFVREMALESGDYLGREFEVFALDGERPERGMMLASYGEHLTVANLPGEGESMYISPFASTQRACPEAAVYRLVRNSAGHLEVRQMLGGVLGRTDYVWNGETFLFPDGSKRR